MLLGSIPSPSSGNLHVGPFTIHMYGLMLLLGIVAAIWLTAVRWTRLGGDRELVFQAAVWGVAGGVVGARAYHDLTSWNEVPHTWWGPFAVWQGGLGIWGGITIGVVAGAIVVRRAGQSVFLMMDAVAPGLLLAQAIGRWGNWWNQELFGKPTDLPWGLEIDPDHNFGYPAGTTFHPTFLYEFLWDLTGAAVLLVVGGRFRIRPPALFALYVAIYTFGRTFEELLRVDPSHHFLGERLNFWVSLALLLLSASAFVWIQFYRATAPPPVVGRPDRRPTTAMSVPKGRVRRRR